MRTYKKLYQPSDFDLSDILAYRLVLKCIDLVCNRHKDIPSYALIRESEAFAVNSIKEN